MLITVEIVGRVFCLFVVGGRGRVNTCSMHLYIKVLLAKELPADGLVFDDDVHAKGALAVRAVLEDVRGGGSGR